MKQHTQDFKEEIKLIGKQQDVQIIYGDTVLTSEQINSVTASYEASLLKSIMKQLEIDSNEKIPVGTEIAFKYGLWVNGAYEYIDYGRYIVKEAEKQEDTGSYLITCYDKLLYSMKDYENIGVVYPISVKDYLIGICNHLGLTFKDSNFANANRIIQNELYLDTEGGDLGYKFRDVLDEIAQVTGGVICINSNDELEVRYINETSDTIDEEYLKDVNVNFGEKYGPINSIVLSRAGESDNVYLQNETSVTENGLCELKIIDNQIMNFNDRSDYLQELLEKLDGVEYYLNDFTSTGIVYYDLLDKYNVKIGDNIYTCLMINDEVNITQGLEELVYTDMPETSETDYTKADKTDIKLNQVYIMANKQEGKITALASQTETIERNVNELDEKVETEVANLQSQIDGQIQFWNGAEIPTLSNYPANQWNTEEDRNNHRADIYTVIQDIDGELKQGKSYRFDKVVGNWVWIELTDNELSAVQALANSKAKVFVATPKVPYNIGDLWLKDEELYECINSKDATSEFSETDWVKATKYTDDTLASEAKTIAEQAEENAQNAISQLEDIASDSKFTPDEKQNTSKEWQTILEEKSGILAQGQRYEIDTTEYETAYNNLNSYITPLLSDLTTTSDINGEEFREKFVDYYTSRTELLNLVNEKQNAIAQALQSEVTLIKTTEEGREHYLTNSANANCKTVEIFGESTQETREGTNLFDANKIANTDIVVSDNGKTITMPLETNTAYNGILTTNKMLSELCPNLKVGDNAVLSFNTTSNLNKFIYLSAPSSRVWSANSVLAITEDILNSIVSLYGNRANSGETEQVIITDLRINVDTQKEWEPFGKMPSPEFPSEIESVRGKNLLQNNATSTTINGITFTVNSDGTVIAKGTATSNAVLDIGRNLENTFKAGDYIASGCPSGGSSSSYQITVFKAVGATGTPIGADIGTGATFKLTEDSKLWLRLVVYAGKTVSDLVFKPMISTTPTFYVPYNHIGFKSTGKNLFSYSSMMWNTATYTYTKLKENTKYVLYVKLKDGQTIPSDLFVGFSEQGRYNNAQKIKWLVQSGGINSKGQIDNITTDNIILPYISVYPATYASQLEDIFDIQLEYEDYSSYEPYKESIITIPLLHDMRSLPNGVRDRIYRDNSTGKWYDEQNVQEHINAPASKLNLHAESGNYYGTDGIPTASVNTAYIYSDRIVGNYSYTDGTGYVVGNGGTLVIFGSSEETLETYNAKYAGTKVYCPLAKPIITEITDETTIEALESIRTFKGITNITTDAPSILTYYTDSTIVQEMVTKSEFTITNEQINAEVRKKVGEDEIIAKINLSAEQAEIDANKISLKR